MKYLPVVLLLFFYSCSKEIKLDITPHLQPTGLLPDNSKAAGKIPFLISADYMKSISVFNGYASALRGKPTRGDKSPPIVTISAPVTQSIVSGTVQITASASDNVGVVSTGILIDNISVSGNLSYAWNTDLYSTGYHVITAIAKDAAGNQGAYSVTVLINSVIITPPPPSTEVSLTTPTPMNQGGEGSCVAFAVGYAARSIECFYQTNTMLTFSPEFLYNQIKFSADCNSGSAMQTGLDFVMNNGVCTWQSMPYSSTNGCSLLPDNSQSTEALNFKISSYSRIYCTDRTMIKSRIDGHHPVIISVVVDNDFIAAKPGFIWKSSSGYVYGHCVIICGYDDAKNAYKIMNSFGTGWGDAGYSWIDYDFFPTVTGTYCYSIN